MSFIDKIKSLGKSVNMTNLKSHYDNNKKSYKMAAPIVALAVAGALYKNKKKLGKMSSRLFKLSGRKAKKARSGRKAKKARSGRKAKRSRSGRKAKKARKARSARKAKRSRSGRKAKRSRSGRKH